MKKEEILALFKSYEDAVCMIDETECRSARDLQKLFGYSLWQNFTNVIAKAKEACTNVGQDVIDHFIDVNKMITAGKGAERNVDDIQLTHHACFLYTISSPYAKKNVISVTISRRNKYLCVLK